MKVILDLHKPSQVWASEQRVSSYEGYKELQKLYPEDEYIVDIDSAEEYMLLCEKEVMGEIQNFCDDCMLSYEDFNAWIQWCSVKDRIISEEEDLFYYYMELERYSWEQYWDDYRWMSNNC